METKRKQIIRYVAKRTIHTIIFTVFFVPLVIIFDPAHGLGFPYGWQEEFMKRLEQEWVMIVIVSIITCISVSCVDYRRKYPKQKKDKPENK